ncbi:MAG: hypothetical protein HC876_02945 [Chloroflexaceae bacterium]|nr:hypothetical protein [Chloroflexaceae bacterium]
MPTHRLIRRLSGVLLVLLLTVSLPAAAPLWSQEAAASFKSAQPVVQPLQPAAITVSIPDYTGPAVLVVYDSTGRAVGNWEFPVTSGLALVRVVPRGTLGEHTALLFASGSVVADGPLYTLDATSTVATGVEDIDLLYSQVRDFMLGAQLNYVLDGQYVHGYRSPDSPLLWLRDHYYQGRAFRYFDADVTSLLDAFRREQYPDGSFPDFLARPEFNIPAFRTPVEADVEYLYVLAVYEAWQMTGDDAWLLSHLEAMQRALNYTLTDPIRWEPTLGLVMRPFTIDTWDFEYGPSTIDPNTQQPAPRHWIDADTKWGIFHGDNTGLAQALNALATVEEYLGDPQSAAQRRALARDIMIRLNNMSWNGSFYTHHVKLWPYDVPGVDESKQLSLSNAIALNRGVLSFDQGQAIINEYRSRLQQRDRVAFAEWFSIDPPFPAGSFGLANRLGERPGEYVNGGIMPLVGGELARGAFNHGYEDYGFDILRRYYDLIERTGQTFLWYYPTGGPGIGSDDTIPTDGWGASAMVGGLIEGAAGVVDNGIRFSDVTISPRWSVRNDVETAYVVTRYAASDGYVAYRWQRTEERGRTYLRLETTGSGQQVTARLMLPADTRSVRGVSINGQPVPYTIEQVGLSSQYVVPSVALPTDVAQIEVELRTR